MNKTEQKVAKIRPYLGHTFDEVKEEYDSESDESSSHELKPSTKILYKKKKVNSAL